MKTRGARMPSRNQGLQPQPFFPGDWVVVKPHTKAQDSHGSEDRWVGSVVVVRATDTPPYRWYLVSRNAAGSGYWYAERVLGLCQPGVFRRRLDGSDGLLPIWVGTDVYLSGDRSPGRGVHRVCTMSVEDGDGLPRFVALTIVNTRAGTSAKVRIGSVVVSAAHAVSARARWEPITSTAATRQLEAPDEF